jgi:hypothetical protein
MFAGYGDAVTSTVNTMKVSLAATVTDVEPDDTTAMF